MIVLDEIGQMRFVEGDIEDTRETVLVCKLCYQVVENYQAPELRPGWTYLASRQVINTDYIQAVQAAEAAYSEYIQAVNDREDFRPGCMTQAMINQLGSIYSGLERKAQSILMEVSNG
jgi:hypothetical protein